MDENKDYKMSSAIHIDMRIIHTVDAVIYSKTTGMLMSLHRVLC